MYIKSRKQIIFDIDEEQKEFLNKMRDFCLHTKIKFDEKDSIYNLLNDMEAFISDMRQGIPFDTHK